MKNQNYTLLIKFLDKFYNHAEIPWVELTWSKLYRNSQTPPHVRNQIGSFWWKHILKLSDKFRQMAIGNPNKGNSIMLWQDNWNNPILKTLHPQLFSFARKPKCSIKFFPESEINRMFFLPLSTQASVLQSLLQQNSWDANLEDSLLVDI